MKRSMIKKYAEEVLVTTYISHSTNQLNGLRQSKYDTYFEKKKIF